MQVLWDTLRAIADGFFFTPVHINRNFYGAPHVDRNNVGLSMAFALGDYTGGELVDETENPRILACHDAHRRPVILTDTAHAGCSPTMARATPLAHK